jgi:hypothetical protein
MSPKNSEILREISRSLLAISKGDVEAFKQATDVFVQKAQANLSMSLSRDDF